MGSPALKELFRASLPRNPYCSHRKSADRILTRRLALRYPYIEFNPPHVVNWLVFDLDRDAYRPGHAGMAWSEAGLPPPAWCAFDPDERGPNVPGHVAYGLRIPVPRTDAARLKPLRYLAAIESVYGAKLRADSGFAGLLTKNPLHPRWDVLFPAEAAGGTGIYTLAELAKFVDLRGVTRRKRPTREHLPAGLVWRNVMLFDELRAWAYRAIRDYWAPGGYADWAEAVLAEAAARNDFGEKGPLSFRELRGLARSVAKWTWRHITPQGRRELIEATHTSELQARRGAQKGKSKRDKGMTMLAAGASAQDVMDALGVTDRTIRNWRQNLERKKPISDKGP